MTDTKFHKKIPRKSMSKKIELIPMKRIATKNDIAEYIYYLINNNNFIANEVINIAGGE